MQGVGAAVAARVDVMQPKGVWPVMGVLALAGAFAFSACSGSSPATPGGEGGGGDPVPPPLSPVDTFAAWPGPSTVRGADPAGVLGDDISGLVWTQEGSAERAVVWAVQNNPGRLFRLVEVQGSWRPDPAAGWEEGRILRYPDGTGEPDVEGVTVAWGPTVASGATVAPGVTVASGSTVASGPGAATLNVASQGWVAVYAAAERDNANSGLSRNSILRFEAPVASQAGGEAADGPLLATHEWNLTEQLPSTGANGGLEAITWVPDSALVALGFRDGRTGGMYDPSTYPNHGNGLFFVGIEDTGEVRVFALDHATGAALEVQRIDAVFDHVTALEFDIDAGELWLLCDDRCEGRTAVLRVTEESGGSGGGSGSGVTGLFEVVTRHERPADAANWNVEGLAVAPGSVCVAGVDTRSVLWADDGATDDHSLREGALSCDP